MNSSTSRKIRQLVDRGAIGIVGGPDARILSMINRTVDVEGIDHRQMTNIRFGTLCGLVQTNRGPATKDWQLPSSIKLLTPKKDRQSYHASKWKHSVIT